MKTQPDSWNDWKHKRDRADVIAEACLLGPGVGFGFMVLIPGTDLQHAAFWMASTVYIVGYWLHRAIRR